MEACVVRHISTVNRRSRKPPGPSQCSSPDTKIGSARGRTSPDSWRSRPGIFLTRGARHVAHRATRRDRQVRCAADGGSADVGPTDAEQGEDPADPVGDTISVLDALLETSNDEGATLERTASEEGAGVSSPGGVQTRGRDQRRELRALEERLELQHIIIRLLATQIDPSGGARGLLPDLVWLAGSDLDQPFVSAASQRSQRDALAPPPSGGSAADVTPLPVMTLPYVVAPGELLTLRLFEPRWLRLFAKVLAEDAAAADVLVTAAGAPGVDLSSDPVVGPALQVYEGELGLFDGQGSEAARPYGGSVVSGHGRMDEATFTATRRFGVCLREGRGAGAALAPVGTVMEVVGSDVALGAQGLPVLTVLARGVHRFRSTGVRQREPYHVLDARPFADPDPTLLPEGASTAEDVSCRMVREALGRAMGAVQGSEEGIRRLAEGGAALGLVPLQQRGRRLLEDSFQVTREARVLGDLTLGVMLLRTRPRAAQALLESACASDRQVAVEQWLQYGGSQGGSGGGGVSFVLGYVLPLVPIVLLLGLFLSNYVIF